MRAHRDIHGWRLSRGANLIDDILVKELIMIDFSDSMYRASGHTHTKRSVVDFFLLLLLFFPRVSFIFPTGIRPIKHVSIMNNNKDKVSLLVNSATGTAVNDH